MFDLISSFHFATLNTYIQGLTLFVKFWPCNTAI